MSASTADALRDSLKGARPVMRGSFDGYSVENVLHALSITRQFTGVELHDRGRRLAGRVYLKSGMVLAVEAPHLRATGIEAFHKLMQQPLGSYCVYRLPPLTTYPFPIGRLSARLLAPESEAVAQRAPEPEPDLIREAAPEVEAAGPALAAVPPPRPPLMRRVAPAPEPPAVQLPRPATAAVVLAVASPKGGCGKTTIALNLSVSLARQGLRVILVDVDPNGDVLSAIAGRDRVQLGVYDAVMAGRDPAQLLLRTVVSGLSVLPAMGPSFELEQLEAPPTVAQWRHVFSALAPHAEVVLVDTAAGVFGVTAAVLQACTHVLGVLQAEVIARRSFGMFERGLSSLATPPQIVGVVLNMFQRSHSASVSVLADAAGELAADRLFDTTIPRAPDFLSSSDAGMPLRMLGGDSPSAVTWLFDMLAGEVRTRIGLEAPPPRRAPTSFLL